MKMIIRNTNIQSEKFDFLVPCEVSINQKITYVDFDFEDNEKQNLTGKFFLNIDEDDLVDFNFHHIKTTNIIFFRFLNRWGIIDIKKKQIKRNELDNSLDCPFFYLHENCILIVDDLFAETITLAGETIDRIGNEQPYEIKELDDYFEFDICGVGKRKLMKKASANNGFIKWLRLGFSFGKTSMSRKFVYICFGL